MRVFLGEMFKGDSTDWSTGVGDIALVKPLAARRDGAIGTGLFVFSCPLVMVVAGTGLGWRWV